MRISKKILACVLAALMAISMMPFTAFAATTRDVASGADLKTAVAAAEDGDTIRFTNSFTMTAAQVGFTVDKDLTFDLNGQTISGPANGALKTAAGKTEKTVVMIVTGADVVFTDSQGGGSWTYTYSGSSNAFFCDIRDNASVTVEGGTYTADALNYAGSIFYVRSATSALDIEDGTFNVVGGSKVDNAVYANSGTTVINGGTFNANNGTDNSVSITQSATVTINDGEFNAKASVPSSSTKIAVYGGKFKTYDGYVSTAVANYTAGNKVIDTETGEVVAADPTTVAKIGNDQYASLAAAIAAVPASGTIKLVNDVTVSSTIEITDGKKFTINLNGNDITASTRLMNIRHGNVTIGGTGTVNTTFTNANSAFAVYGSTNSADANYSVLTIQTYVVINSNGYGAMIGANGSASFGAVLTVYGTINSRYGIYANGNIAETNSANAAKVTVGTTSTPAAISSSDADSVIYAAGYANWTINNATFTGGSPIYIKSGNMTIKKGTFTANGAKTDYVFNNNGCDITGDCVIIDSCGYPGSVPTVTINGGTFTSANGAAVASYCKQDDPRYPTAEYPRVANVIPGTSTAVFSSDVSALCAAGFKTVLDTENNVYYVTEVEDTMSITVADNIDLNINMDTADERVETIEYTFADPNSQEEDATKTVTKSAKDDVTSFTVALSPAQVMDDITAVAKDENGDVIREVTTSIADYCNTIITTVAANPTAFGAKSTELAELAKSTLDYGKAASDYFDYNTAAYTGYTTQLDDPTSAIADLAETAGKGSYDHYLFRITSVSYVATSVPELRFYFESDNFTQNDFSDMNEYITCENGTAKFVKLEGTNQYILQIKNINITDFTTPVVVRLGGTGTEGTQILNFTPIVWVNAAIKKSGTALGELGKAIGNYYLASDAYFEQI